ncbi:M-phase phosphoprotein 9 [Denticeps clupeoides]|uniref:M-phase phosphoprotein 9 n=1 Tax=Denticeps clupeoides TaxID=299321 RepID=A0AAY4BWL7_9TELE|nr:M-phase phosphoprotein 9 [Denticeps clupeoides]
MSTDDSISEDVSSSVAQSHDHASANFGKGSEASIVSSEDTASGLAGPEEDQSPASSGQTLEGFLHASAETLSTRPPASPACNISQKIRRLFLNAEEDINSGRSLAVINPGFLETLRTLVEEIQESGETEPEIWKNCEGRWLQLFQLVEKQYKEQIRAQQEQYQCQIQLTQNEIKTLVQLQNQQSSDQPHALDLSTPVSKDLTSIPDVVNGRQQSHSALQTLSSLSPPKPSAILGQSSEEGTVTVQLSSGYGTLSTWEPALDSGLRGSAERACVERNEVRWPTIHLDHRLGNTPSPDAIVKGQEHQQEMQNIMAKPAVVTKLISPNRPPASSQPLTSWAQKQKHRQKKDKPAQESFSSQPEETEERSPAGNFNQENKGCTVEPCNLITIRRSDSLFSEASGLTYWKLDENELYHPLPDSFDSGAFLLLPEVSRSQTPPNENRPSVSLREIYQSKQRGEHKCQEWDLFSHSNTSSPQVLTLDPTVHTRQSERTSGFTSPSHFSSPSFPSQPLACHGSLAPISPDSVVLQTQTDTDCTSNASSLSGHQLPEPSREAASSTSHAAQQRRRRSSEEDCSHTATLTLRPFQQPSREPQLGARGDLERVPSLEDPVVLSLLRQSLREKHSRHIADVRAYYESEISLLKEKLNLADLPRDVEKSNQVLLERCKYLEQALNEARTCVVELENKNRLLEKQLAEWPERYESASATVQALQLRLEEIKLNSREKDATVTKLRQCIRQLEDAVQNAYRDVDDREARLKKEHKMMQDLLLEYESLRKDHESSKDKLVLTENKLYEANEQIFDLKRLISKLESQVKQLEHENMAKSRQAAHSHSQPSGAGLFHHPDLLVSPNKRHHEVESCARKCLRPDLVSSWSSDKTVNEDRRHVSPPLKESQEPAVGKREVVLTPMMKALIQMEETRATEGRAVSRSNYTSSRLDRRRPTLGFVESGLQEPLQAKAGAVLKAQRSLSPLGHRSSSLPPRAQRAVPVSTPTKRETLITPLSAKSSPKRCPTENFSTAFEPPPTLQHYRHNRFDLLLDQKGGGSLVASHLSPRKRLCFKEPERTEVNQESCHITPESGDSSQPAEEGTARSAWQDQETDAPLELPDFRNDLGVSYQNQLQSLTDAERLFDELTQEKQQIEAALSRIPGTGARATLQSRLDEVTLENRLERVNHDLGSIRMTLKRFNILRNSSNI